MWSVRKKQHQFVLLLAIVALIVVFCCYLSVQSLQGELNSREHFSSAPTNRSRKFPGAIIIGARKAGTRALVVFLNLHPQVRSVLTELHYFSSQYHRGVEWYRSQMPSVGPDTLVVEKCPDYLVHPDAPKRVFELIPNVKIIMIARDPVERAISDYCQLEDVYIQRGGRAGTFPKFEQLAFRDASFHEVNSTWRPIEAGKYTNHLFSWLRFFPREQIHLVSGEQLTSHPHRVMADVQSFLRLERLVTKDNFRFSQKRGFWCYRSAKAQPEVCLGKSKGRPHPQVHPDAVQALRRFYQPWNQRFYQLTGVDFLWPEPEL